MLTYLLSRFRHMRDVSKKVKYYSTKPFLPQACWVPFRIANFRLKKANRYKSASYSCQIYKSVYLPGPFGGLGNIMQDDFGIRDLSVGKSHSGTTSGSPSLFAICVTLPRSFFRYFSNSLSSNADFPLICA